MDLQKYLMKLEMEDYRKADPSYVGFVPKTASQAIDLFCRYRKLGVRTNQYPETFCHVSRSLPEGELEKFEAWLIQPQGPSERTPVYEASPEIETERKLLLEEAIARDENAKTE